MSITVQEIDELLRIRSENSHLEFKEARNRFEFEKLLEYCVALANEGGGRIVLGVTDAAPRRVVGTRAFEHPERTVSGILEKLHFRVNVEEVLHPGGRVLVFDVPARPLGCPVHLDGRYLMRAGESLVPMSSDQIRRVCAEGEPDWCSRDACADLGPDDIVALLDTQAFFDLLKTPYPTQRSGVLERLASEGLIHLSSKGRWSVRNLGAILFAKNLTEFSLELTRKAPRVIFYSGANKLVTRADHTELKGYAASFESLVALVHSSAPRNRFVEEAVREEVKMFPIQALRELIANALIHQDFNVSGSSVMIEMYDDRVEISNPGLPPIEVSRFIDEYRSRNERLADLMRRMGICEEKGSGVDKVVAAAETYQLPAPDFRVGAHRTTAVLFSHQDFHEMGKADRIRACYQHCCLLYVSNKRMSNQSLRDRFRLPEAKTSVVSAVIGTTKEAGLIKLDDSETASTRYARYLPIWA